MRLFIFLSLLSFFTFPVLAQQYHQNNILDNNNDLNSVLQNRQINDHISNVKKRTEITSQRSLVWNWDTIYTYDANTVLERHTQSFDNFGKPITQYKELIDTYDNSWNYSDRHDYFYDANGNDTLILCQQWTNETWDNYDRVIKHYNQNNELLSDETEAWYSSWTKRWKWSYSYDISGNMLTQLFETKYNDTLLVNGFRFTYTYDINSNLLSTFQEDWQNGAWQNAVKDSLSYNLNGMLTSKIRIIWQDSAWIFSLRYSYSYDSNNLLSSELCEKWVINSWTSLNIQNYSYDNAGNLLSCLLQSAQGESLTNINRYLYTYDLNGNMLTYQFQKWQYNTWDNNWNWKRSYSYDDNNNSVTGKYEYWGNNSWLPGSDNLLVLSDKNIVYRVGNLYRYDAKFSNPYSNIEFKENIDLIRLIYPNPAHNKLHIEFNNNGESLISIYNIQGQIVLSKTVHRSTNEIDISGLPKGFYLIRMNGKDNSVVNKFVKE
jgi:hypothetical protein